MGSLYGDFHSGALAMTNRRVDAIYFLVFLLVLGVGYAIAQSDDEAEDGRLSGSALLELSFPVIEFELPLEFSYSFVKFARPAPPELALSENTESVRQELRSSLLESSTLVEVEKSVARPGEEKTAHKVESQLASISGVLE
jgi:hypothetical protein